MKEKTSLRGETELDEHNIIIVYCTIVLQGMRGASEAIRRECLRVTC